MLFGPQYDDDTTERPTPSPIRKKKVRSVRTAPLRGGNDGGTPRRRPRRGGATTPKQNQAGADGASVKARRSAAAASSRDFGIGATGTSMMHRPTAHETEISLLAQPEDTRVMYATVWKALQFRKKTIPLASSASVKPICVTGVDGFLASWIACELLSRGYRVRGTVQNRNDDVSGILTLPSAKNFTVVETSLLTPEACDLAVRGCEFVIHTGTPSSCAVRDPLAEQQDPGVHSVGSRMHCIIPMMTNFVQACARAHVKRVVLTSSIAAMADAVTPSSIINEASWNITSTLDKNPHFLSLKLAEEAAWQLVDQLPSDCRIDLVTINPGTLFGPSLSRSRLAPGNQVIYDLITGQYSALVDLNWSMVDVRDCALAHVAALENMEARGRYVCVNRCVWMKEIVDFLAHNGYKGRDLPWRLGLPNWVARLPSYSTQLGQVGASLYGFDPYGTRGSPFLNEKVIDNLNISFRDAETTIVESANDLLKWGLIKPWAEDHEALECDICKNIFTFYRRKHHCRECGVIICADCSKSRAVIEGTEGPVRLCDQCVEHSVPILLETLADEDESNQKRAVVAIESLMQNETNHDYVTRNDGIARLLKMLRHPDEATCSHAAGALAALSTNVSSSLQMVLEGAVLQMLEVEETTKTWAICLQALRNMWNHINRGDYRQMLHAVARVSSSINKGPLQGNIILTYVHMMDEAEVPSLLSEGLLPVLFNMLQSEDPFPRCAAAHAVKHLVPATYDPDVSIDVPPYHVDNHEELFQNASLSDLQFMVKGHIAPINAHKVVLFFRNTYFKNMVRGGDSVHEPSVIEIDNCSYEVFSMLLRFLYTGQVNITSDVAQELLRASSFYRVYELQKRAEEFLAGEIRVDNVVELLSLAEECNAVDLKRNCVPFLIRNIHDVVRLASYRDHRMKASEEVLRAVSTMLGGEWEAAFQRMMEQLMAGKKLRQQRTNLDGSPLTLPTDPVPASTDTAKGFAPSYLSPSATQSSSNGYANTTADESPRLNVVGEDQAMLDKAFVKFGSHDLLFGRSRGMSDDLSEVLSEGVC